MNVKGKSVLITGGAGGLGSVIAKKLASNGADIFILDLPAAKDAAEKLIEELKAFDVSAFYEPIDLTNEEEWKTVIADVCSKTEKIDVLVNNAGINIRKPIEEMSYEEWMTMMSVNTGGVFLGVKYVLPEMRKQGGGAIINTSSVCGLIGHRFTPEAYTATKGAVTLFTKAVASRYASQGIRCNSIHPSTVDTPLVHERLKDPQFASERLGEVPLGRLATAEDVANAVLYLASEEASFINGIALPIDGGVTCC
ncbi:MAG: SDR family oxidoreductase [Lachnospiraceae bacterium]|nr:SDR family oxidoreductase [Lachnospiraceae bacterium]